MWYNYLIYNANHYPFGSTLPGRSNSADSYRYGFQNQEAENEISGSTGSHSFFKYRISDNRLGRFFSVDPLASSYPHNSSYAFAENRVIDGVELEGLEWRPYDSDGNTVEINGNGNPVNENTTISEYRWEGYTMQYSLGGRTYENLPFGLQRFATPQGLAAPSGTVANGSVWTGENSMRFYSSSGRPNLIEAGTITNVSITDQVTINRIGELHPSIRNTVREILIRSEFENGQRLRITTGFRNEADQNNLYRQSRTQAQVNAARDAWGNSIGGVAQPNAQWATNATWGQGYHNYGLAIDVVGYNNNQINWNIDWNAYHNLGRRFGGETVTGDNPHLSLNFGINWNTLRDLPTDNNGFVILP